MRRMLVTYMTLGYPNLESFYQFIEKSVELGTDILEIGLPPKYAKYDGPVIRKSYKAVTSWLKDYITPLKEVRKKVNIPIIILTYLEDYLSNLDNFLTTLHEIGIDGVLFPDLLIDFIDEYEEYVSKIKGKGVKAVLFTGPSLPDNLIIKASRISDIFLYYGVRPTTGIIIPVSVDSLITRVRNLVQNKLVVGFGLNDFNDLRKALSAGADGVAIGTAFIEEIEKNGIQSALHLVKTIRGILDEYS
ncbi:tryptophan synthase subunit alpha [Sulfurisphaera tokodaii]|uniref:Tryptophan synthase alpha chain n=2 Tax=Sulfurisphaera tokodaii TaxID=111955 RepID=TRPA_SULTO|nr:tryptophan synthase subunit alpha [Sulfurisphaera tokodaii]Q971Z6.1 RecName: Full=Tryptophan synthase alpha chain [Sulfurisphaera tokodaii str. 7]BAB66273.1 tryptophan synthase alpha chain [Sulfurisphaera tokodaii str. 7]HII73254.1 tryptophan synthase subunit alpha [Sulfurisphaera tokodaii]